MPYFPTLNIIYFYILLFIKYNFHYQKFYIKLKFIQYDFDFQKYIFKKISLFRIYTFEK